MYKKLISVMTSAFLVVSPFSTISSFAVEEETENNSFIMNYNYLDNTIESVLSIDGNICIGGFDAILNYDSEKYIVETSKSVNPNVLMNVIPSKNEIIISMASAENLSKTSDLVNISFSCLGIPEKSDFNFEISDVYMIDENYDSKSVDYSFVEEWKGINDISSQTETTVTTTNTTTNTSKTTETTTIITTETTTSSTSKNNSITNTTTSLTSPVITTTVTQTDDTQKLINNFIISINENKDTNSVELSLLTKGDVKFWTAEGIINIVSNGLGEPSISTSIPDSLSSYKADENNIYFSIVSSTGENITKEQNVFTYIFPIENSDYSISCSGKIKDICDQNYNDVDYVINEENNTSSSSVTTTSVISSTVSQTTTTSSSSIVSSQTTTTFSSSTSSETSQTLTSSLSTISNTTSSEETNISPYEFSNWAKNDYYQKTGIKAHMSEYIENSNGTISINLLDENGNILDTYTIHKKTGIGFDSEGNEVNLPQTGNNSLNNVFLILSSLTAVFVGAYIIYWSNIRKKDEK